MSRCSLALVGALLAVLMALAMGRAALALDAEYGVCEEQIATDLDARFRQKVSRIDWTFVSYRVSEAGLKSQALVYTDDCPGYHVYDVFATDHDCLSRVHYGTVPNYVRYRVSEAGC